MFVPWFNYNASSITRDSQGKRVQFARQHAKVRDFTSRHACLEVKFGFRQVQVCFIGGSLPVILSSMEQNENAIFFTSEKNRIANQNVDTIMFHWWKKIVWPMKTLIHFSTVQREDTIFILRRLPRINLYMHGIKNVNSETALISCCKSNFIGSVDCLI